MAMAHVEKAGASRPFSFAFAIPWLCDHP